MKLDWDRAAFINAEKDEFNYNLGNVDDLTKPRHGLPLVIQTDCMTNFTSKVFRGKWAELAIRHVTSVLYQPESQGVVERFHQTLNSVLKKHCYDHDSAWDKDVPFALSAIRNHPNFSTDIAPFKLVFAHKVHEPLEIDLRYPSPTGRRK
ncbi:igE-binding protein-like [Palaemon carinicauda]|uniref:igE-binding protein-like n=1 Tax=Palaemon carinicauda TaxID=392227 RepID=UPI0035B5BB72